MKINSNMRKKLFNFSIIGLSLIVLVVGGFVIKTISDERKFRDEPYTNFQKLYDYVENSNGDITIKGLKVKDSSKLNLERLWIPSHINNSPVISIAADAFKNNNQIKELVIGENLQTIGNYAFAGCFNLESVRVSSYPSNISNGPSNLQIIGNGAFSLNRSLTTVGDFPNLGEIGNSAFLECPLLCQFTLQDKVTKIGEFAFYECGFSSFFVPETVETIGIKAFNSKSINIFAAAESPADGWEDSWHLYEDINPVVWNAKHSDLPKFDGSFSS